MQHARRIANATGVHRHIDDLLLDLRRLTGVAIHQQEGPSTPLAARPAPIALLAFRGQTMLDNIGPLAIGAVQHLHNHRCSLSHGWFCSAQTLIQDSRSTALKHLPLLEPFGITRFYTDGWGAYERHIDPEQHMVGKENTQKIESKHINLRTR